MEKRKVGRPKKIVKDKKMRMAYISEAEHLFYYSYGQGNFSRGLAVVKDILNKIIQKN